MPWWGNSLLASQFTRAVGEYFGPSYVNYGPMFVSSATSGQLDGYTYSFGSISGSGSVSSIALSRTFNGFTFAKATIASSSAVPEPLTILGAMTAAGFGAGFKRKLAKSKKSQDDTSV